MTDNGFKTFTIIWLGLLVSFIGSAMTRFALLVWAYQQTQQATTVALLGFFAFAPLVLLSPLAGVWVDRLDRRWVMIVTDLGAGLITLMLLSLYWSGNLEIWHLFVAESVTGLLEAFQMPAYDAAITMLVPKKHYARTSGMRSISHYGSIIIGPFLGGALLGVMGLSGVMLIDVITFLVAMVTLFYVSIPHPQPRQDDTSPQGNIWHEMRFGFSYIFARPGLRGLLLIFAGINFFAALTYFAILPSLILARTGHNEFALAVVQGMLGFGGVMGGICLSLWGGPKRQIHGVLFGAGISFLVSDMLFAVGQDLIVWSVAAFIAGFFIPFIVGANRVIWQQKVAPQVQGRVFSIQSMVQTGTMPLGYLLAGPLADHIFEPALAVNGPWVDTFGWLVGNGPGAGMGFMFVCTAIGGMLISFSGYVFPAVRCVEDDLPDHDFASGISNPPLTHQKAENAV